MSKSLKKQQEEIVKLRASGAKLWQLTNPFAVRRHDAPRDLWEKACAYFKWCDETAIESEKTITSGFTAGQIVTEYYTRPYLIKALCLYTGYDEEYLKHIRTMSDKNDEMYQVVTAIIYIIWTQNVELASVGLISPVFTQKVLGMDMSDERPSAITVNIVEGLPKLATSENEILESVKLERGELVKDR